MGIITTFYGGTTSAASSTIPSVFAESNLALSPLAQYRGHPILIINTASRCGFASQYDALEEIWQRCKERGLIVLGFPSNDFLGQEPGSDEEIQSVCRINHGVTFPLMPKASVKGGQQQPVFAYLTQRGPRDLQGAVRWNFEKFLLDREGRLIGRWRSYVSPRSRSVARAIEIALR